MLFWALAVIAVVFAVLGSTYHGLEAHSSEYNEERRWHHIKWCLAFGACVAVLIVAVHELKSAIVLAVLGVVLTAQLRKMFQSKVFLAADNWSSVAKK